MCTEGVDTWDQEPDPPEEKNELFQGPNILLPLRLIMCKIQSWIQK